MRWRPRSGTPISYELGGLFPISLVEEWSVISILNNRENTKMDGEADIERKEGQNPPLPIHYLVNKSPNNIYRSLEAAAASCCMHRISRNSSFSSLSDGQSEINE